MSMLDALKAMQEERDQQSAVEEALLLAMTEMALGTMSADKLVEARESAVVSRDEGIKEATETISRQFNAVIAMIDARLEELRWK